MAKPRQQWTGTFDRKKFKKVNILGFTPHKMLAPLNDPTYEVWGLNDLYVDLPKHLPYDRMRWFQIHKWAEVKDGEAGPCNFDGGPVHGRDPNHVAWMKEVAGQMPLYMFEPRPEVPDAIILKKEEFYQHFSLDGENPTNYFTNTITWMIGLAIMEGYEEIGVYGVDMMMAGGDGSEYGYQRPSCEWLLGWARGAGIKVVVPAESDLLKTAFAYGDHEQSVYRKKLVSHKAELQSRLNGVRGQIASAQQGVNELVGGIQILEWQLKSWMPGDGELSGGTAPLPNTHKVPPSEVAGG